jgi:enamine deaminase RidA (YjgF/YER057c/UK114 family)
MAWRRIYSGSGGEQRVGYCRAIVLPDPGGDWVIVSGTTGFDYAAGTISPDPVEQCEQALRNIEKAMAEAGAAWADVFLYRVYVLDAATWDAVVPVIARVIGPHKPATTAVIAPAMDSKLKVEIELEARLKPSAARAAPGVRPASRASATRKATAKARPAKKRARR